MSTRHLRGKMVAHGLEKLLQIRLRYEPAQTCDINLPVIGIRVRSFFLAFRIRDVHVQFEIIGHLGSVKG
jgi:hypothetical protein